MSSAHLSTEDTEKIVDHKLGVFIEHMDDQFERVLFVLDEMRDEMNSFAKKSDLEEVKTEVNAIKLAVTATNQDLRHLEKRVERLEAAS